jgi:DNA-binding transcriptional LysR family regulator
VYDAIFGLYHAAGQSPQVAQEAIQMQTIVNLVSAGLGVAWVPDSVRQFQRSGVSYRSVEVPAGLVLPGCETSLVWPRLKVSPALERFVAFLQASDVP